MYCIYSLPSDKLSVTCIMKFVFHRVENVMRKGENTSYQQITLPNDKILDVSKLKAFADNK